MWRFFMDVVARSRCKVFVIENVPNLLRSPEGQEMIECATELGYCVTEESHGILLASDFGVPQNRRRALAIVSRILSI
jgi:DNA (cytosine-5)-methyltransferase 1